MRGACAALAMAVLLVPQRVAAEDDLDDPTKWLKELDLQAGVVEADLRLRELDLRDRVRVRLSPYYLRSEQIHLSLGKWGVRVVGSGILGFCPCEDPPVAIGFSGGWAGPPDELIVEGPTLRIAGVPVFWLPYLWLRSPRKVGLGLPQVAFRGVDGLFLGQTLHLPLGRGMEIGVGGYTRAGFGASLDFATDTSLTRVSFDARSAGAVAGSGAPSGLGLNLDLRGDLGRGPATVAWDVWALRGARGVRTTLDRETLAHPFDHATAVARVGPAGLGFELLGVRGGDLGRVDLARSQVFLAESFALGDRGGAYFATSLGPRIRAGYAPDLLADATFGLELGGSLSTLSWTTTARLDGRGARGDDRVFAGAAEARGELSWPLARPLDLERARGGPRVVHVLEPLLRTSAIVAGHSGGDPALLGFVARPSLDAGHAVLGAIGLRSLLGTTGLAPGLDPWIGALRGELSVGVLATARREGIAALELSHTTRDARGGRFELSVAGAATRPFGGDPLGWVGLARAHWDHSRDGLGLELRTSARDAVPVLTGLAVLGAELGPRLGQTTWLGASGVTAGMGLALPRFWGLRLGAEIDGFRDENGTRLLEARGTLRYRHPCGCFRLFVRGGHVLGREGVDVLASADLTESPP